MSEQEREGRDSLYVRGRVSAKTIGSLVAAIVSITGVAGKTLEQQAELEKLRGEVKLLRDDVQRAERAYTSTERYCAIERALIDEIAARVSLAAAEAEPDRRRRLQAGADAQERFVAAASWWPCPINPLTDRAGKPSLAHIAASAAKAPVPGR